MRSITLALLAVGLFCTDVTGQIQTQPTTRSIGQITAVFGDAQIESGARARIANVFSTFRNDERVRTGDAGLSLVLRTRLVVKLDALTSVRFSEGIGQTHVQLEGGAVQVFAGRRAAYMGDAGVQDALVRMDGKNAVFFASYDPGARSGYYACEHGTVTIESAADHQRFTLNADQQAIAAEGKALEISALDRATYNRHQRTLQRLGQSVVAQGSQTQRTRATALDTRNALTQLEAAGWIDRKLLAEARPLSQQSNEDSEQAKTTQNQVASSSGSSSSASTEEAPVEPSDAAVASATIEAPPAPSAQSEPSAVPAPNETMPLPSASSESVTEVRAPSESSVASISDVDDLSPAVQQENRTDSLKVETINDLPKVKLPKIEKVDRNDDLKKDLPDLKLPKLDKSNPGKNADVKEIKDVTKQSRDKVEKNDNRGGKGKK